MYQPTSLDLDAAHKRASNAARYGGTIDPTDLDTLREGGYEALALRIEVEAEQARATKEPFETHATIEGMTFTVRLFRMGDGWNWTVRGQGHTFGFSGQRCWANQRLAFEDAVARIEDEVL